MARRRKVCEGSEAKTVKLFPVYCILLVMATAPLETFDVGGMARTPSVARALAWTSRNGDWITQQQIRLTEIPAPTFQEKERGQALKKIFESIGMKARADKVGNIVAERPGASSDVLLIAAHLDTVFPAGTDVKVRREGQRMTAPGIADNGAGLAALLAAARALNEGRVRTGWTIVFAGDVGEEGEGNLLGIHALVESYRPRLRAVIALDGAAADYVATQGLASRRFEIVVTGPGGHSWYDFGAPNPITALARGIVRFSGIRLPDLPRTSYNFGVIEGGTSVNSIPGRASVKVDMRSEDEATLSKLESTLTDSMQAGVRDEMAASAASGPLDIKFTSLGVRPGGALAKNSSLLAAIQEVDVFLGNQSRLETSSTDANVPLSVGIAAVAIGGGGEGGGAHSLREWYDGSSRNAGLHRLLLTILAVAGVQS